MHGNWPLLPTPPNKTSPDELVRANAGRNFTMTPHSYPHAPTQFVEMADFSRRDENLRYLSSGVLRKLAGLPRDLFADYWRDVLGPLCARLPGISYYVQHHFSQDHWANLW